MTTSAPTTSVDPIISRLRPRSVAEILDQGFRLYRRHFLTFLAISAVIFVPVQIASESINVFIQGSNSELTNSAFVRSDVQSGRMNEILITEFVLFGLLLVVGVVGGILQQLSQGALTAEVADSYLDRPVSFGSGYRQTFRHAGPLLGVIGFQILAIVAVFAPIVVLFLIALTAAGLAAGSSGAGAAEGGALAAMCLGFLLIIPAFLLYAYIFIRWTVAVPAVMVENLGPRQALGRSWRLVQNYWWRTLALVIVLAIMNLVISLGPAYLLVAIVAIFTKSLDPVTSAVITGTVSIITQMVFVPLELTAYTLYYFDLRVRKEGFDIETAMAQRYWPQQGLHMATASGPAYYPYEQASQPQASPVSPPALGYTPPPGYAGYGQAYEQGAPAPTRPVLPSEPLSSARPQGPAPGNDSPESSGSEDTPANGASTPSPG